MGNSSVGSEGRTGIAALDQRPLWDGGRDFGLDTPRKLLASLGNPQDAIPAIHVGGTNGKGSVCSFISAILYQAGKTVGQFTSPHLSHVVERCLINGSAVTVDDLSRSVDEAISAAEACGVDPSFFELVSAASYLEFRQRDLDYAVIEVGLGGRLDATNLMSNQCATVITNVQYDHMHILGDTLAKIALEKAGILRSGIPLVLGRMEQEPLNVILQRAQELDVPTSVFGRDFWLSGSKSCVEFPDGTSVAIPNNLPLQGDHQLDNAAVAVGLAKVLGISDAEIYQGLGRTRWPGRLEWAEGCGDSDAKVLLDVGHNEDGIKSVLSYLQSYVPSSGISKIGVVCSILERKEWQHMLDILRDGFESISVDSGVSVEFFFTVSAHKSAVDAKLLKDRFGSGEVCAKPTEALESACEFAGNSGVAVVLGSAYLVGDLRPQVIEGPFRTIA